MPKFGMVIDLHKCVGCGACNIACKKKNNVDTGIFWAHHLIKTTGKFPNVKYEYIPTLCNHCENASCVANCPTGAMYQTAAGFVLNNPQRCIGCKVCMVSCPYDKISYNSKKPHQAWQDDDAFTTGTSTPQEVTDKLGVATPYYDPQGVKIRPKGIVEKCIFCTYCVEVCPAQARIFGDLDNPESEVSILLSRYDSRNLRPERGTKPKVYYIRQYNG